MSPIIDLAKLLSLPAGSSAKFVQPPLSWTRSTASRTSPGSIQSGSSGGRSTERSDGKSCWSQHVRCTGTEARARHLERLAQPLPRLRPSNDWSGGQCWTAYARRLPNILSNKSSNGQLTLSSSPYQWSSWRLCGWPSGAASRFAIPLRSKAHASPYHIDPTLVRVGYVSDLGHCILHDPVPIITKCSLPYLAPFCCGSPLICYGISQSCAPRRRPLQHLFSILAPLSVKRPPSRE